MKRAPATCGTALLTSSSHYTALDQFPSSALATVLEYAHYEQPHREEITVIEVASAPRDLATWDAQTQPLYLELFGETRPTVNQTYAEVLPAYADSDTVTPAGSGPLYQYWWTIGHSSAPDQLERIWSKLQDEVAGRVYLFFPLSGGWRIKELVATVNYLHPFREHATWQNKIADEWKNFVAPTLADASTLAGAVPNPAFAGASTLLGAIAKVQVNSVPQGPNFQWSVGKITTHHHQYGVMQGIMWTLPKKMFTDLGSRLTGSVALSFIPAHAQQTGAVASDRPPLQPLSILAHAVIYRPHGMSDDLWVPGKEEFIELLVEPQYAASTTKG